MQLLSEISVHGPSGNPVIQLLQGDLTALPKEQEADILIISAFPNDYTPLPGSLMHALYEKGINVAELSENKAINLVEQLGCWLSKPLSDVQQEQFNFKQILCFEPRQEAGSPETAVGNIFRCINNFVFDDDNNVIAMPVLASGKQKVPVEKMLPAMLDACIFWLESGVPLHCIKLVLYSDVQSQNALPLFNYAKQQYEAKQFPQPIGGGKTKTSGDDKPVIPQPPRKNTITPGPAPAKPVTPVASNNTYDFFISYSHVHTAQVTELVNALKAKDNNLNIFYDRSSIPTGGLWIKLISDAIQKSTYVICILSPEYRNSNVCWDEFQCAKAKEYRSKKPVIKTINFLKDDDMPLIMSLYSYIDCTEADLQKLKEAVNQILA